jgi:hypothetical protein
MRACLESRVYPYEKLTDLSELNFFAYFSERARSVNFFHTPELSTHAETWAVVGASVVVMTVLCALIVWWRRRLAAKRRRHFHHLFYPHEESNGDRSAVPLSYAERFMCARLYMPPTRARTLSMNAISALHIRMHVSCRWHASTACVAATQFVSIVQCVQVRT